MKLILNISKKLFMLSLVMVAVAVLFSNLAYAYEGVEDEYLYEEYDEQDLLEKYAEQEKLIQDEIEKMKRIETEIGEYAYTDELGLLSFDVAEDVLESLSQESKAYLHAIETSKNLEEQGKLAIIEMSGENTLALAEGSDDFIAQNAGIRYVNVYTSFLWFDNVWTGFDLVAQNRLWSFVIAGLGLGISSANMILDILLLDTTVITRIGLAYPITVVNLASQFFSHLAKVPAYVLTALKLFIQSAIGTIASQFVWVVRLLGFLFPPLVHSIGIINLASANKTVALEYRPLYSNYRSV